MPGSENLTGYPFSMETRQLFTALVNKKSLINIKEFDY